MKIPAVACVRHLINEYRRFLRTSYRFLDPHLRVQFEEHLSQIDVVVKGPYVTLTQEFENGKTLRAHVESGEADPDLLKANWPFGEQPLYRHQEKAFKAGRAGHSFVVTTGTGSGKTEAFLLPILNGIIKRKREGVQGVQAILLYPMNALANDQLERMRRLLRGSGLPISFAMYTGDSDASSQNLQEEPAETERLTRAAIRQNPPDILLTNYKQLEFLLIRREDRTLFTPSLRYLVLDELHSYRGALATEIACLIRRLKKHAGLEENQLQGMATSATVASGEGGAVSLAQFATVLFGEAFREENIIEETYVTRKQSSTRWVPALPQLCKEDLLDLNPDEENSVISLAEKLTGRSCPTAGAIPDRISAILAGNAVVEALEQIFSKPCLVDKGAKLLSEHVPERSGINLELLRREVEGYLLIGSIGDDNNPPRLRPKLHTFFHGVYDVSLCLNPECRKLVPQGGSECASCGSAARPAALCRTCGQDFVKVRFGKEGGDIPVGTGDFFTDSLTAFLTHGIHELPDALGTSDDEASEKSEEHEKPRTRVREPQDSDKLQPVSVCIQCGRVMEPGKTCPEHESGVPYWERQGKLSTCPACGDTYPRGDIVTPLRTGTASTVSILVNHHLDFLVGEDRRILVFGDNRQDVAHQAGYATNKHRAFALRHVIANEVRQAGNDGIYLQELPERLFDQYKALGIITGRPTRPERELWLKGLTYETANELSRYSRQRASLETLGLVGVEYEFLEELEKERSFELAARNAGLDKQTALDLTRAILDIMRKNRAVAFDFFQEYLDPEKKRQYRELEAEPYNLRFPDKDKQPKGFALNRPDHIRASQGSKILGFFQENLHSGSMTAVEKVAKRLIREREKAREFLESVVPLLVKLEILLPVPHFPLPAKDRVGRLQVLQINPKIIRLVHCTNGFRCNACQTWRPYFLNTCPTPKCGRGTMQQSVPDRDNYYVHLYEDRPPQKLVLKEHSAHIAGEERAKRESEFKDGSLTGLVCTPTLELGVDIGPLLTLVLRNAPPTPANYVQRVGRAGRRLRIGFVSTFCAGSYHDRHAFEEPEWLISGHFSPPRLRLDNAYVVERHLRSFLLESIESHIPRLMGDFLDDLRNPTAWNPEKLNQLCSEIASKKGILIGKLAALFAQDRAQGRTEHYDVGECEKLLDEFEIKIKNIFEKWWQRVKLLDTEYQQFSAVGSSRHDDKKAKARQRAYKEITQDPERSYVLNYLSIQGLLPAYQFPVDTFSLDPGVVDTPTLYRPSPIAIDEFAPGNYVYANGHKLRSIRVLFAGGPGRSGTTQGRTDAETSGRLAAFHFCDDCDAVTEAGQNNCHQCGKSFPSSAKSCVFVDAFEAEEALQIGSDEESRERRFFVRHENLLPALDNECRLYHYPYAPVEFRRLAPILITNGGQADSKTAEETGFWLCPECGRHQPYDPNEMEPAHARTNDTWRQNHSRICQGEPEKFMLSYRFQADCLILTVPHIQDEMLIGKTTLSPLIVTLAEALLAGATNLLELEPHELAAFPKKTVGRENAAEIVFYETVPGGAGYVEEMARRLPEVAAKARKRLYEHECAKACYICLKHYRNQRWHPFFDKDRVRDILLTLANTQAVDPVPISPGAGAKALGEALEARKIEFATGRAPGQSGPQSPIEERLFQALQNLDGVPLPQPQYEIRNGDVLITVPDFAYPDLKIAIFCDGYAFHGNSETLELDARKRNWLQREGWAVLTFWGKTINHNSDVCAREIQEVYLARSRRKVS